MVLLVNDTVGRRAVSGYMQARSVAELYRRLIAHLRSRVRFNPGVTLMFVFVTLSRKTTFSSPTGSKEGRTATLASTSGDHNIYETPDIPSGTILAVVNACSTSATVTFVLFCADTHQTTVVATASSWVHIFAMCPEQTVLCIR